MTTWLEESHAIHRDNRANCPLASLSLRIEVWNTRAPAQAAQIDAAVKAERERCAQVADAYADENISMAGDSVLFDPVLKSRPGETLTRTDFEKSKNLILDGAIHSAMFHAAQNIAAAIRNGEQS
jgi:hypothetical protein